jgi:hypothetical protein
LTPGILWPKKFHRRKSSLDKIRSRVISLSLHAIASRLDNFPMAGAQSLLNKYYLYMWRDEPVWYASLKNEVETVDTNWLSNFIYGTDLRTPIPVLKKALIAVADIIQLDFFPKKEDQLIPLDGFLINLHIGQNGEYQSVHIHKRDEEEKIMWTPYHRIYSYSPDGLTTFSQA